MTRNIQSEYFDWLCSLVRDSKPSSRSSYKKLLMYLFNTEFVYVMPMDSNRYADGLDLRYRFGREHNLEDPVIASCLDTNPCSIFEMMVALSFRCEEHIMFNPLAGLQSGRWFWMMINNLGLSQMTDSRFDENYVNCVVWRFLDRKYDPDGTGGLIRIPNSKDDLRNIEIWYQLMRYLSEIRRNGD